MFSFWGERERENNDFGTQKQMILLFARAHPIGVGTHFSTVDPGRGAGRQKYSVGRNKERDTNTSLGKIPWVFILSGELLLQFGTRAIIKPRQRFSGL